MMIGKGAGLLGEIVSPQCHHVSLMEGDTRRARQSEASNDPYSTMDGNKTEDIFVHVQYYNYCACAV